MLLSYADFFAGITQLVECNLAKVDVAGSSPVSRSKRNFLKGRESGPSSFGSQAVIEITIFPKCCALSR